MTPLAGMTEFSPVRGGEPGRAAPVTGHSLGLSMSLRVPQTISASPKLRCRQFFSKQALFSPAAGFDYKQRSVILHLMDG
jgi:hypothetical protein